MPGDDLTIKATGWTFQQGDGSNFTTVGVDVSKKYGIFNASSYVGFGTSLNQQDYLRDEKGNIIFDENGQKTKNGTVNTAGVVIDLKGSVPYGSLFDGRVQLGMSGRLRNYKNEYADMSYAQVRVMPLNVDIPLGERTKLYVSPYVQARLGYDGNSSLSMGGYVGVDVQATDKLALKAEAQVYDPTNINSGTVSGNVGFSWKF